MTALGGLGGAVLGIFKYFNYRSHKDRMDAVGTRFTSVVDALGSKDEVKRRAAAIMLRRFFDPSTEFGVAGTPYANEAVNVIAAILREERSGSFQKLLADGLWFARSLRHADLQKTNLQNAFLGARGNLPVDLSGADFFRADLSDASLKGAIAAGAIFYQARLAHTVFNGADLSGANFFEADLQGARFKNARLEGADFSGARNLPKEIADHLDVQGRWVAEPAPADRAARQQGGRPVRIFLSRPALMRAQGMNQVELLKHELAKLGPIEFIELPRHEYPSFGALAEVRNLISGCAGVVVLGLGELEIADATWRAGTAEEERLQAAQWPSPWIQIEAGVGIGLDLPVLLVAAPSINTGIFAADADGHVVFRLGGVSDLASERSRHDLDDWYLTACERERERARA
jgi:uncharacterized protein YjbI with pentapeptide repeats